MDSAANPMFSLTDLPTAKKPEKNAPNPKVEKAFPKIALGIDIFTTFLLYMVTKTYDKTNFVHH